MDTQIDDDLPDWAKKMTDEEWEQFKKEYDVERDDLNAKLKLNTPLEKDNPFQNCAKCGKRLIVTLCKHEETKYYCETCCPEHKWQSDYDWETECARCGISYTDYLQSLLEQYNVPFSKP